MSRLLSKVELTLLTGHRVTPEHVPIIEGHFNHRFNESYYTTQREYEVGVKFMSRGFMSEGDRNFIIDNFVSSMRHEIYGDLIADLRTLERHLYDHDVSAAKLRVREILRKIQL
jgi:hypothetical protein